MAKEQIEREDKYEVGQQFVLPDLASLAPVGGRVEIRPLRLESAYFDTADGDLLARGLTLRRRTGTTDEGWQLKVPTGDSRTEVRLDLTSATSVPRELRNLTAGARLGRPLRRTVVIRTERTVHRIVDDAGQLLLEVADDQVHAYAPGKSSVLLSGWREIEAELAPSGDREILTRASLLLSAAGATLSRSPNKVARALGAAAPVTLRTKSKRRARTAGDVLQPYLADQDEALITGDLLLRRGYDAIHPTRVATRRLRSTLRIYADFFEPSRAEELDVELAWYAGLLGSVRDPDVQRARLLNAVEKLPQELVVGPVAARIEEHLRAEKELHQATLKRAMNSQRYLKLLQETAQWATEPPFTPAAGKKPDALRGAVEAGAKKAAKHLQAGLRSGEDEELHKARKAGKRARYAAELAQPVLGKKAEASVARYERLQDILGDHQDSIGAAAQLRSIGASTSALPGENGFTFGLLYAAQQHQAERSRAKAVRWAAKM